MTLADVQPAPTPDALSASLVRRQIYENTMTDTTRDVPRIDEGEIHDWLESLDAVIDQHGLTATGRLLQELARRAEHAGVRLPFTANTPYLNTIQPEEDPAYPGDRDLEQRLKSLIRWNALAMVVRANRHADGIGGHISTFASAATLYEVGFNHFFRAPTDNQPGDLVYYQGHASPGIYARAHLEGRFSREHLENFRRELKGPGLSSYPHPWLMPNFWEFPTVSMGLSPIMAIYQARYQRYLEDRGLIPPSDAKVWAFLGDGETDEPESLGAITLASRERLDNLIFVVNCNLQRLDGPVRGNGQIIQELEAAFRGAGWNAIKVIWGRDWDPLLAADEEGLLVRRMSETVDGQYQKYAVESGAYVRDHFWGKHQGLRDLVTHLSDKELKKLRLGGHDPAKVYSAFAAAIAHRGPDRDRPRPAGHRPHQLRDRRGDRPGAGPGDRGRGRAAGRLGRVLDRPPRRSKRTRAWDHTRPGNEGRRTGPYVRRPFPFALRRSDSNMTPVKFRGRLGYGCRRLPIFPPASENRPRFRTGRPSWTPPGKSSESSATKRPPCGTSSGVRASRRARSTTTTARRRRSSPPSPTTARAASPRF